MSIISTIALGVFSSIVFYFIELRIIRKYYIAKITGLEKLDNQKINNEDRIYYLTIKNESKRVDAFNVCVYVEFLNEQEKPTGYSEKRDFPFVGKKQENVYYTLFSNISREKRKEVTKQLFERSKKIRVVITCQNQYGKIKKTDDFIIDIEEKKAPVAIFDFQM